MVHTGGISIDGGQKRTPTVLVGVFGYMVGSLLVLPSFIDNLLGS